MQVASSMSWQATVFLYCFPSLVSVGCAQQLREGTYRNAINLEVGSAKSAQQARTRDAGSPSPKVCDDRL